MSTFVRSTNHGRAFVATCVGAAFLWALALSVSPQLHRCIHADANRAEHSCVVTAVSIGSYEHTGPPPLVTGPQPGVGLSKTVGLNCVWVQPLFLCAHNFAHAPPRLA